MVWQNYEFGEGNDGFSSDEHRAVGTALEEVGGEDELCFEEVLLFVGQGLVRGYKRGREGRREERVD